MPNDDLISRKALQAAFENECVGECGCCKHVKHNPEGCALIDNAPAVDAEPVRYGKLNVHTVWHTLGWGEIFTKFECCGFEERGTKKYNYCPNCGAKMENPT